MQNVAPVIKWVIAHKHWWQGCQRKREREHFYKAAGPAFINNYCNNIYLKNKARESSKLNI